MSANVLSSVRVMHIACSRMHCRICANALLNMRARGALTLGEGGRRQRAQRRRVPHRRHRAPRRGRTGGRVRGRAAVRAARRGHPSGRARPRPRGGAGAAVLVCAPSPPPPRPPPPPWLRLACARAPHVWRGCVAAPTRVRVTHARRLPQIPGAAAESVAMAALARAHAAELDARDDSAAAAAAAAAVRAGSGGARSCGRWGGGRDVRGRVRRRRPRAHSGARSRVARARRCARGLLVCFRA